VRPGQITDAHQEFTDDLPAREAKRLAKEFCPIFRRTWVMGFEPARERPVRLPQRLEASGISGGGFNLKPVTDDPRIAEQAVELGRAEGSDAIDRELRKGSTECRAF